MYFILLLVMTFLARFLKASDQYLNNLQPGCFPVPSLFENFSTAPEYWPHGTPLLQTLAKSADTSHFVKRISGSWDGWQNVHNIFALYAWSLLNWHGTLVDKEIIVVIRTQALISLSTDHNRVRAIR